MSTPSNPVFKPRARLLLQLGDQLIKNENIAVLELVKNSYDADARNVTIKMESVDKKEIGKIEIIDDGCGMDDTIIKTAWLEPGSDYKEKLYKEGKRSEKYDRLPIGEKGIGRFGVHKLGNKIELITRKKNENEIVVIIDWEEFIKKKYLEQAEIKIITQIPKYFLRDRHGTRIIITKLRTDWDRRMVRDLYKSLFTLSSPFKTVDHFTIKFNIDRKGWLDNLINWEEVKDYALYYYKVKIKGSEIVEFTYKFKPWENLDKVKEKTITLGDQFIQDHKTIEVPSQEDKKKLVEIDLDKHKIGDVEFEGYIFDRDIKILGLLEEQKVSQIKRYLDENGGIRVYRDNLRINEYGERGNDWLNLDIRRVNVPTVRISNNIILSIINIKRENSSDLIEKTNREGFVENDAYNDFRTAIMYVINIIEKLRQVDKAELRDKYSPSEQEEPVLHHTSELKIYIEKNVKEESIREKLNEYIDDIEKDYDEINKILLTSAGAGLTLGVGIHEIEKLIKELVSAIKDGENVTSKISNLVQDIQETVNNYLNLLKQEDKKTYKLKELIKGGLNNVEYRLKIHDIKFEKKYLEFNGDPFVDCSKRFFISAILNVVDNSIYWLEKKFKSQKKIGIDFHKKMFVDIFNEKGGAISVLIADNGNGFTLPTNKVILPFITAKDEGMGLGLHIANQILKVSGASLLFPQKGEYDIPEEFQNGAKIIFRFKKI